MLREGKCCDTSQNKNNDEILEDVVFLFWVYVNLPVPLRRQISFERHLKSARRQTAEMTGFADKELYIHSDILLSVWVNGSAVEGMLQQ